MTDDGSEQSPDVRDRALAAIILAAGKSTRMKSHLPKVMHDICGRSMLSHVLRACGNSGIDQFFIVVGFGKDLITQTYADDSALRFVEQSEQKGTGHAVLVCEEALRGFDGDVVVLAGDMPMIREQTLRDLIEGHRSAGAAASLATTVLEDPSGYGRILRDSDGGFERIVEHRDCSAEQLEICEVNPSYYCFDAPVLFSALHDIRPDNAKGEYYITDVFEILRGLGKTVQAVTRVPADDAVGINSRADLADVARRMQRRIQTGWMDNAVTIIDPSTTWIDSRAQIGPDSEIKPFSTIEGNARIGSNCLVGPYAYVTSGAVIEDGTTLGPGVLRAFDTTGESRNHSHPSSHRRATKVVRRPPPASIDGEEGGSLSSKCSPGSPSC